MVLKYEEDAPWFTSSQHVQINPFLLELLIAFDLKCSDLVAEVPFLKVLGVLAGPEVLQALG